MHAPVACVIFLITIATSILSFNDKVLENKFILHPWSLVREKKWYTLITSGLIHGNIPHLLMNMLAFYYYGFILERLFVYEQGSHSPASWPEWLPAVVGRTKFFLMYMLSMVLADVTTILKNKDHPEYRALGASGAISGMVMAFILLRPTEFKIFGLDAWIFGLIFLGVSYLFSKNQADNVNHEAHLWGGVSGAVLTLIFYPHVVGEIWERITG